tara:strand:+ start:1748 stop:2578 length:831 start_codon:yes stop_codon:yes gene_type:complete
MPFIGTQPEVGGYSVLDALTASATASYTLQKSSANFVPNTANQLLVSLNGVIQKPGSSFTVSGSTLTFSSALDSSDSIDFIMAMGEPLLIGTPSDGTVSTGKIATNAVTDAKIAAMTATKLTGTVASARFPTGSVINTTQGSITISNSASATTSYVAICTLGTVTTTQASSKILVMSNVPVQVQKTNMITTVQVRSSLDSYSASLQQQHMTNYDTNGHDLPFTGTNFIHTHGQAAGVAITYKYYIKGSNSNAGFYSPDAWGQSGFSYNTEFLEIAG